MRQGRPGGIMGTTTVVYILDDDRAVREGFARLLRASGMDPRPYADAGTFLEEIRNLPHACVLLDISMPHMSGAQVQAELNTRSITLPVLAVSAREDEHTLASAYDLGARMFLRKPVDEQTLLDAITGVTGSPVPLR